MILFFNLFLDNIIDYFIYYKFKRINNNMHGIRCRKKGKLSRSRGTIFGMNSDLLCNLIMSSSLRLWQKCGFGKCRVHGCVLSPLNTFERKFFLIFLYLINHFLYLKNHESCTIFSAKSQFLKF